MTDKELLEQFDAMSKEWFSGYGYSERKIMNENNECIIVMRSGYAGWKVNDEDENGMVEELWLSPSERKIEISLFSSNTNNKMLLFWCIMSILTKYFKVHYDSRNSIEEKNVFSFNIEGLSS